MAGSARILNSFNRVATIAGQLRQLEGREAAALLTRTGLDVPKTIDTLRALKIAARAPDYIRRRSSRHASEPHEVSLQNNGYTQLPDSLTGGAQDVVSHCAALFEKKREAIEASYNSEWGNLVIRIAADEKGETRLEDPSEIKPIVDFLTRPEITEFASRYIGEKPVLAGASLIYTKPNSAKVDAQLFHRDMNDRTQLHLLFPIWPIDLDTGPFTLLPKPQSQKVIDKVGTRKIRIPDEEVEALVPTEEYVRLTGTPGMIYACNPFECIHYGGRAKSKPRLILIVNLVSLFEGIESTDRIYRAVNRSALDDGSPAVRSLLNIT